jgi:hypothetical protein
VVKVCRNPTGVGSIPTYHVHEDHLDVVHVGRMAIRNA